MATTINTIINREALKKAIRDYNAQAIDAKALAEAVKAEHNTAIDNILREAPSIDAAIALISNTSMYSVTISDAKTAKLFTYIGYLDITSRAKQLCCAKGADPKAKYCNFFTADMFHKLEGFFEKLKKHVNAENKTDNSVSINTLVNDLQDFFPAQFEREGKRLYATKIMRQDIRYMLSNISNISNTIQGAYKFISFNRFCRVFTNFLYVRLTSADYTLIDKEHIRKEISTEEGQVTLVNP